MKALFLALCFTFCFLFLQAQDFAREKLNASPRHHEWVQVKANGRTINCFVAYPEQAKSAHTVIVLHENRGLTDWVRSFTDQVAAIGYLAVAPDLLSDFSTNLRKTSDFADPDKAREAIYQLDPEQVTNDLDAIFRYVSNIPSANGAVSVIGFCWGGSQAFRYATNNPELKAALVFYGTAPDDPEQIEKIEAPVYGFYGGDDQRVNATLSKTESLMQEAGNTFEYVIYPGAGHAYMRSGAAPDAKRANKEAMEQSWERIKNILAREDLKK